MGRVLLCGVLISTALPGCSSSPPCEPSSSAGCCTLTGRCELGTQAVACGAVGNMCEPCTVEQICSAGRCIPSGAGGGTAGGAANGGGSAVCVVGGTGPQQGTDGG